MTNTLTMSGREAINMPSKATEDNNNVTPASESNEGEFSSYIANAMSLNTPWLDVLNTISARMVSTASRPTISSNRATLGLPDVHVGETTPAQHDNDNTGTASTLAGDGQPANGLYHRDTRTNLTTQDECARAHNGHTTPGSVTLSSTTILNDQHKDLIMSQSRSVSRQPPTPLTAQQVHRDQPPDEHPDGAKRVAGVGLRSHVSSPHFPVPPTTTTDSVTNNVTGESSNTATVTNNATDSSSIQRSRQELWSVPPDTRPVPPEEDTSTPAHPLVKLTKALNHIDNQAQNMYVKLKQILNKIHKLYTSNTTALNNVLNSIHWQNVKFYLPEADQHELHQIIHTVSAPLLNCIQEHCKESMCTLYHNVITTINNTYHVIHTDEMSCHIAEHTTESKIHESIHKLLKHLKENENNVNQHTITQQTHTYNSTISHNSNNTQQTNTYNSTMSHNSNNTQQTNINTYNSTMSHNSNNTQQTNTYNNTMSPNSNNTQQYNHKHT